MKNQIEKARKTFTYSDSKEAHAQLAWHEATLATFKSIAIKAYHEWQGETARRYTAWCEEIIGMIKRIRECNDIDETRLSQMLEKMNVPDINDCDWQLTLTHNSAIFH